MPRLHNPLSSRRRGLQLLDVLELASHHLPLDVLKEAGSDWELVEDGDDTTDGYKWSEPTKCECGLSWNVHDASAFFNQKSTAQDITTLYATIQFPDKPSEPCDEPWDAVVQGRCKRFRIFKNKTTDKFWLFCTKRVQWHCEIVEL
jgi:hypothetical protein